MTLLEQLDRVLPGWRVDYDGDALRAAIDLGLIEPDSENEDDGSDYGPLDFHDHERAWRQLPDYMAEYDDEEPDDDE